MPPPSESYRGRPPPGSDRGARPGGGYLGPATPGARCHAPSGQGYRGAYGAPRPAALAGLALPPAPMPPRQGLRPLKRWRYVGVYGKELMLCLASIRIGPVRQAFWAVWDRREGRLHERTAIGRGSVRLAPGSALVSQPELMLELTWEEQAGVETVCPSGASYAWTRKQGGVAGARPCSARRPPVRDRRPRRDR